MKSIEIKGGIWRRTWRVEHEGTEPGVKSGVTKVREGRNEMMEGRRKEVSKL